jgi:Zn-dependent protease
MGTLFLLVANFGWGKPVQINPYNFHSKYKMDTAEALVAIAGPVSNFITAFIFVIIYFLLGTFSEVISAIVLSTAIMNIALGVFNLIPIPPLDGSKVLFKFIGYKAKNWFVQNSMYLTILFFALIFIPSASGGSLLSSITRPIMNAIFVFMFNAVNAVL